MDTKRAEPAVNVEEVVAGAEEPVIGAEQPPIGFEEPADGVENASGSIEEPVTDPKEFAGDVEDVAVGLQNPAIDAEESVPRGESGRRGEESGIFEYMTKIDLVGRIRSVRPLLLVTVVVPTFLAALYFGFFASDVYISQSEFVVRSPDKPATTGLGVLLKSTGFANAGDEIYAARDYVLSRDALQALNHKGAFVEAYTAPSISIFDKFNPTGWKGSFEDLFKYYGKKVSINQDSTSSIITLSVRAYAPKDAQKFNEQLLEMAEATVNKLNERGRNDLIRFARAEVEDAEGRARDAALALSAYRNRQGVVDPEKQATVQLQMVSKLQDELIATRTQLRELRAFAPQNPQIEVLATRVKSLESAIDEQSGQVAGDSKSLSSRAVQYQRLALESQFADKQLAAAMASLEEARNEARRKQAYVERIVQPNLPDDALEPRRLRGIFSTLLLGIAAWGILSMLLAGMLEHRD